MEKAGINDLIVKYNQRTATADEIQQIEKLIERGEIDFTQLTDLHQLSEKLDAQREVVPSIELDHRFYEMLSIEKGKSKPVAFSFPEWKILWPRLAMACAILVAGFIGGLWFDRPAINKDVKQLTLQLESLKEMMMISLLEKESATERLKAVNLTQDIAGPSQKVTEALLKTLNADANVNVRLAALDALQGYANLAHVREGLVRSIALQESPLVQVALADLMVAIQEKSSVAELKKVLDQQQTPKEVKEKIKKSIQVLI